MQVDKKGHTLGPLYRWGALAPGVTIPAVSTALALPFLTRVLPSAEFGVYVLATSLLLFLQSISNGWLTTSIVRYRPAVIEVGERRTFVATVYLQCAKWSSLTVIIYVSLLAGLSPFFPVHLAFWLIPIQLFALNLIAVLAQTDRADGRYLLFNWLNVTRGFASVTLGLMAVLFWSPGAFEYMCGSTTAWFLIALVPVTSWRRLVRDGVGPDSSLSRRLSSFGLPLIPSFLFIQVLDISDRFIIGFFHGPTIAGAYAAGYILASTPYQFLILFLGAGAAPYLVRLWEGGDTSQAEGLCAHLTLLMLGIGTALLLSALLNVEDYSRLIGPPSLASGAGVVPWISIAGLALAVQWIAQRGLMLHERTRSILVIYTFAGVLNVVANLALVGPFGILGAAWATLGCNLLVLTLIARAARPFRWWPRATDALTVCGVAAVVAVSLSLALSTVGGAGSNSLFLSVARLGIIVATAGTAAVLVCELPRRKPKRNLGVVDHRRHGWDPGSTDRPAAGPRS